MYNFAHYTLKIVIKNIAVPMFFLQGSRIDFLLLEFIWLKWVNVEKGVT